jgi:hypothetical protein
VRTVFASVKRPLTVSTVVIIVKTVAKALKQLFVNADTVNANSTDITPETDPLSFQM